jgi:hypothetical protein
MSRSIYARVALVGVLGLALVLGWVSVARAQGIGTHVDVNRHEMYLTGVSLTPDLRVVNVDWPWWLEPLTCDGQSSVYYVIVEGPKIVEGQPTSAKAQIRLIVERANFGDPDGAVNSIWLECPACPNGGNVRKKTHIGQYSSGSWAQLLFDPINQRWGVHVNGRAIAQITVAEGALLAANKLIVGGGVDVDSGLGPFLHQHVATKTVNNTLWQYFTPSDPSPPDRGANGNAAYKTFYSSPGNLQVFSLDAPSCP